MARARRRAASSVFSSLASSVVSSAVSTPWSSRAPSRASSPVRRGTFPFWELPAEIRVNIYELVLLTGETVDLHPLNWHKLHPRLALFLVCRQMHNEAYPVFYGDQVFRLFPTNGRFFHTPLPLLARLPPHYRSVITTMELRLGHNWHVLPPKSQNTDSSLGLRDCTSLRKLKILIELDPSDPFLAAFRSRNATEETYKLFCVSLLLGIMAQVRSLENVEIDAYPSVKKDSPMVMALRRRVEEAGQKLTWGPLRGWEKEADEPGLIGLEEALAGLGISDSRSSANRMVEVLA